jgi:hypothetical protein
MESYGRERQRFVREPVYGVLLVGESIFTCFTRLRKTNQLYGILVHMQVR